MSSRLQRKQQMKYAHITAIVVGIFIALCGLYFIFGISAQTNKKIARCTESTTGTVSDVKAADSGYVATIDYEIDGSDKSVTVNTKNDPGVGSSMEIRYEPLHYSNLYIEGITPTGSNDIVTGLIMMLAGGAFIGTGILMKKSKDKKKQLQAKEEE